MRENECTSYAIFTKHGVEYLSINFASRYLTPTYTVSSKTLLFHFQSIFWAGMSFTPQWGRSLSSKLNFSLRNRPYVSFKIIIVLGWPTVLGTFKWGWPIGQ